MTTQPDSRLSEAGHRDAEGRAPSSLLTQISNEMVRAQKEYFGRGPTQAKSYLLDDLLLIVMRGGLLPVEQTMLEAGRQDAVRQYRQDFQNEMTTTLIGKMQELTGRRILTYQSQVLFDPHIVVEIFVFDEGATEEQVAETVEGQLGAGSRGEATVGVRDTPPDG